MLKEVRIINLLLSEYKFNGKNVIEFGPSLKKLGLLKYLNGISNNYAIDRCTAYPDTEEKAYQIAKKLNFTLEIANYSDVLEDLEKISHYKILNNNFYNFIYAQCSIEMKYIENMLCLCNKIGTDDGKVFLMPWTNDEIYDREYYINFYSDINYEKYGFKLYEIKDEYMKKMNYLMKYNIIITKNITIPSHMLV